MAGPVVRFGGKFGAMVGAVMVALKLKENYDECKQHSPLTSTINGGSVWVFHGY